MCLNMHTCLRSIVTRAAGSPRSRTVQGVFQTTQTAWLYRAGSTEPILCPCWIPAYLIKVWIYRQVPQLTIFQLLQTLGWSRGKRLLFRPIKMYFICGWTSLAGGVLPNITSCLMKAKRVFTYARTSDVGFWVPLGDGPKKPPSLWSKGQIFISASASSYSKPALIFPLAEQCVTFFCTNCLRLDFVCVTSQWLNLLACVLMEHKLFDSLVLWRVSGSSSPAYNWD